jgi:energy-coupling factor transporter ATP-binding protein EcfA2
MTIKINNLTVRNFMSVGNQTQAIDFDRGQLTLVLGENLDLGGDDSGARNGTGKTTIINGLSYAIYGQALTNIKRDNLVNKINGKGMLVTVTFEKDGVKYHIERGRKPNILKFSINDHEQELVDLDESQGDSRETQKAIEDVFGMKHEMFKHLVALNTYTEPFLSMKAAEQRAIIEQLLGITILSEKAEALKESIKISKDSISTENTRIETVKASNERIQQSIESLIRKQRMWEEQKETALIDLRKNIMTLSSIDIDQEIINQRALVDWTSNKKEHDNLASLLAKQTSALEKEQRILEKLERELLSLAEHRCHSCGQELHDSKHTEIMNAKVDQLKESTDAIDDHRKELDALNQTVALLGEIGACPTVIYDNLEQALSHKNTLAGQERDLTAKIAEINPYDEQITELKETAVQEIDWNNLNALVRVKDHQEFLHKLLTNKDSFVRKRIIDQNLAFLNQRLTYYLDRIGLPHVVEFQNDLTVIITQLGQDLDFDNLSRGERNRLILSLSWAFRDVWENLYTSINLLFIDELVDSGMDASGVESSIAVLKRMTRERDKNVFLISHRDDLTSRVNHVLKVIKENGFTSYSNDIEIVT